MQRESGNAPFPLKKAVTRFQGKRNLQLTRGRHSGHRQAKRRIDIEMGRKSSFGPGPNWAGPCLGHQQDAGRAPIPFQSGSAIVRRGWKFNKFIGEPHAGKTPLSFHGGNRYL